MVFSGAMKNIINLISYYVSSLWNWHKNLFYEFKDKGAVYARRKREGLTRFPRPEEIFDAPSCFILSTGRCGTGLITKILEQSPSLLVYHNPQPELNYVSSLVYRTQPSLESLKLAILAARFDLFVHAFQRGRIYVETNNRITFFAPAIAELFPKAKFIHLIRHPADFVRSGMRREYYQEGIIQHQRLNPLDRQEWQQMSRLEKVAWEWNEINRFIDEFKSSCNSSRMMTIKSEDLFSQTELVMAIFNFLDVSDPFKYASPEHIKKQIFEKPVNKQTTGSFPKFLDWSHEEKVSLRRIATIASKYGYKLD